MKSTRTTHRLAACVAVASVALVAGCSTSGSSSSSSASAGSGKGTISIWAHSGQPGENAALEAAVAGFNKSHPTIHANLRLISADTYTTTVTNTPKSQLPDVLEMDGPTVGAFAYNAKLAPLKQFVSASVVSNATAGAIAEGTSNNTLYALPMYDSALGLYANKKMLDAAGVKYPTSTADAWTPAEFLKALQVLAKANKSGKSLDIDESSLNQEWGTYGFSPVIQSAGGNLIQNGKATGVLNSAASIKAMTEFASWKPYVDPNADGNAFQDGRVALSWSGHWEYPVYSKAIGASNLLDLPLPNFGTGSKTGAGSWTWGIGAATKDGSAAGQFLDYLLDDQNVTAMTNADGAPPATKTAFAADKLYQPGGGLALWGQNLQHTCPASAITSTCVAIYRPVTAGYPTITSNFATALAAIFNGADPKTALTNAAKAIDQNFSDNNGYQQ
ncbi:extracellular solute-binding protein [Rudaeicoccus suwonensis]|uniref:Carbohydrate ABC transporter substrate-binding protein (CUT1 family) n=1 Tax=Rudaeicoccus suwonensis TaxID=657409 RepID=A0A561E7D1_9MICO|nr:extracellular solute-binding protein [Rudaeicoccus suwonensis]TWE11509.1 carbohydrate ABC transporter substrate-binding protein (CUT1 family) [Rudaeicoccus suwonensis]